MFLFVEVWVRVLSTVLVDKWQPPPWSDKETGVSERGENSGIEWKSVFGVYTVLALGAVIGMRWVSFYNDFKEEEEKEQAEELSGLMGDVDQEPAEISTEITCLRTDAGNMLTFDDESKNLGVFLDKNGYQTSNRQCQKNNDRHPNVKSTSEKSPLRKAFAAIDLLLYDPKMKCLSFLNITFGLCTAFCTSVVNGQVIRVALNDDNSTYVGVFTAITSLVAAVLSWVFGVFDWLSHSSSSTMLGVPATSPTPTTAKSVMHFIIPLVTKCSVLTLGVISYLLIALLFLLFPSFSSWNVPSLLVIYILLGIGRSSYEGALRAIYADFFPAEKEGAFANIILFNGLASVVGYCSNVVSSQCSLSGSGQNDDGNLHCVQFNDGSVHNVLIMELTIIVSAALAIGGLWKAEALYLQERRF